MGTVIRSATAADVGQILAFIRALADFERAPEAVVATEEGLLRDGFVIRYDTAGSDDGLPAGEGAFLACSFWLADNYVLQGRLDDARRLFEKLVKLTNDVGLLAEEYDPVQKRQVGNFPQAFSHLSLVQSVLGAHGKMPLREQL